MRTTRICDEKKFGKANAKVRSQIAEVRSKALDADRDGVNSAI
jgi:hypothetical protein